MPKDLIDDKTKFPAAVRVPVDGDEANGANFELPYQQLADRTAFLNEERSISSGGSGSALTSRCRERRSRRARSSPCPSSGAFITTTAEWHDVLYDARTTEVAMTGVSKLRLRISLGTPKNRNRLRRHPEEKRVLCRENAEGTFPVGDSR